MSQFTPSSQQSAIFTSLGLPLPAPSIIVDAKAGTGKTTTIVHGLDYIPTDGFLKPAVVLIAFNKAIAETLKQRCPAWVQSTTGHALSFRALKNSGIVPRNVKVDGSKCKRWVWNAYDRNDPDTKGVIKLVSMAKTIPTESPDRELLADAIFHHDLQIENVDKAVAVVLEVLKRSNDETTIIDFDDMLYMAVIFNARFDKQDYIFVDEAQDTNDIQLEIFKRLMKPVAFVPVDPEDEPREPVFRSPSRLIAVGDPYQAIYGFRGANADSMERIRKTFSCEVFPLSVSYRCPKAVVREAQQYIQPIAV